MIINLPPQKKKSSPEKVKTQNDNLTRFPPGQSNTRLLQLQSHSIKSSFQSAHTSTHTHHSFLTPSFNMFSSQHFQPFFSPSLASDSLSISIAFLPSFHLSLNLIFVFLSVSLSLPPSPPSVFISHSGLSVHVCTLPIKLQSSLIKG